MIIDFIIRPRWNLQTSVTFITLILGDNNDFKLQSKV